MASPLDCYRSTKLHLHFQDQESSSTQSTGQSCPEEGSLETNGYGTSAISNPPLYCGGHAKSEEDQSKSTISFQDTGLSFSSIDYRQYASGTCAYPADLYHCGLFAGYSPYPVVPPQMMGVAPICMPLPPDAAQDEPIYVNSKQIRAILRRRESRAKLGTQNKLQKVRKPYLHESRHLHALKRARGSGGRFVNTKKLQESKAIVKSCGKDMSSTFQLQLKKSSAGSEGHQIQNHNEGIFKTKASCSDMMQNRSEGVSKTTCSDITAASSSESTFQHQDFRFAIYQPLSVGRIQSTQQFLSVLQ